MRYNPDKHHRRSIRLKEYDYTQFGAYFVTICTQNRVCLFGDVVSGKMQLNEAGQIARQCWHDIPCHFPHVELGAFVIMPNHIHGILVIGDSPVVGDSPVGAKNFSPLPSPQSSPSSQPKQRPRGTSKTIGSIVRGFKIGVTKWMRQNTSVEHVWQRNYYEHVIRDENELNRIQEYIADNPGKWESDRENPNAVNFVAPVGAKNFSPLQSSQLIGKNFDGVGI